MNLYKRFVTDISHITGISADVVDRLPEDIDPKLYAKLQNRALSGWFDKKNDRVVLYSPNLNPDESSITGNVIYHYLREKGLASLLGGRYVEFCRLVNNEFYHGGKGMPLPVESKMANDYLSGIPSHDTEKWGKVSTIACRLLGVINDGNVTKAIANGFLSYQKKVAYNARMNNDHLVVDQQAREGLTGLSGDRPNVSLGRCSDPFLRTGYPETELVIRSNNVKLFLNESGLLSDSSVNLSRLIQEPMAILKGENRINSDKLPLNYIVTDHFEKGKGFLSFGIDSPKTILAGYGEQCPKVFVRSARFMSEYSLLNAIAHNEGENISYLKPGKTHGFEISSHLRNMEGRSSFELGKKSDDGNAPVCRLMPESRRLNVATNIVNNFKNPMSAEARKSFFGGILFEDSVRKIQEVKEELKSMSRENITGYTKSPEPVKKVEEPKRGKLVNARTVYFGKGDFSASVLKKLDKANVSTAFDIMTYGKERFVSDFGSRAFKDAIAFLDKNNLSFLNHRTVKRIDESVLQGKDFKEQLEVVYKDMFNGFSALDPSKMDKTVHFPRRADGTYIEGAGGFSLIAKSLSMARWRDCNIFLRRDEAEVMDIRINPHAVPNYVVENGKVNAYYNLSETSFAIEKSESYAMLISEATRRTPEVDQYAKIYVSNFQVPESSGMTTDVYNLDYMDQAYARKYSGKKEMKNDGSFVSMLNSSLEKKLNNSFNEGFMKGKAEGISIMADMKQSQEKTLHKRQMTGVKRHL